MSRDYTKVAEKALKSNNAFDSSKDTINQKKANAYFHDNIERLTPSNSRGVKKNNWVSDLNQESQKFQNVDSELK